MMKRLDEFMFLFMMFLFATGWATNWPTWHVVILVLCILFVLVRSFGPKVKEYLNSRNASEDSSDETK